MAGASPLKAVLDHDLLGRAGYAATERRGDIRLVVQRARHPGHQALRHKLAHEHHAALGAAPHIEAQIELGEVAEARPGHAQHVGIEEIKRNQADKRIAVSRIERQPSRQARAQQLGRNRIAQQQQVRPARSEKRQRHMGGLPRSDARTRAAL